MDDQTKFYSITGWIFGLIIFLIGVINAFWGNDAGFGICILILSFIYFPPVSKYLKKKIGFSIHIIIKLILGILIIWAALGVGELSDKINLMIKDLFQ